ncbi:MAG TPA: DnaA N-terminal domain-containing protein, partial [Thermodesulfobacteriota bacterium]|nr:DnaA N-terminal domain-containing protein [Thermodesulfobacteriota bacterium]
MHALWEEALAALRQALPPQAFEIWIRPLRPRALTGEALELAAPDRFFAEVVAERFQPLLDRVVSAAAGSRLAVRLAVADEGAPAPAAA